MSELDDWNQQVNDDVDWKKSQVRLFGLSIGEEVSIHGHMITPHNLYYE